MFYCGTAQSAGLQVGCSLKASKFGPAEVIFSGSISKVDVKDFADKGTVSVEMQISGNQNKWTIVAPAGYKKIGDRIEFTGSHDLPARGAVPKRFGDFPELKCITK